MAHITQEESLRGLFYIVRGQYRKKAPVVYPEGEEKYIGGYDPEDTSNPEWYRVLDNVTYHCICCGSDLDKCLESIKRMIVHCKTRKNYFRYVCKITSEDYYEQHYLGHAPLKPEQRAKKAEGRCPRVSPHQKLMEKAVFDVYGDYYRDMIEEVEDSAYKTIAEDRPFSKGMKRHKKITIATPHGEEKETPKKTLKKTEKTTEPSSGMKLKKIKKFGKK